MYKRMIFSVIFCAVLASWHGAQAQGVITIEDKGQDLPVINGVDYNDINTLNKLANEGSAVAQALLGQRYLTGNGVAKNYNTARKWLLKAAKAGSPSAHNMLSDMYVEGVGTPQNLTLAYMWLILGEEAHPLLGLEEKSEYLAKHMTAQQQAKGQALARQCAKSDYKKCGL